jgi:hypothetical protein
MLSLFSSSVGTASDLGSGSEYSAARFGSKAPESIFVVNNSDLVLSLTGSNFNGE